MVAMAVERWEHGTRIAPPTNDVLLFLASYARTESPQTATLAMRQTAEVGSHLFQTRGRAMKQAKNNTMKAVAIDRFGGPETLTVETLPVPEVGPDEVLIHVDSADVAVWDPFEREGGFAKLCGIEAAVSPTCSAPTARARSRPSASASAASRKATTSTPPR